MKKNKILKIVVLLLFIICFIELFYKLGDIPYGIFVDEAGSMYDAISLSHYGVDRYLYHNPVYFINFGGGQNALYTYLAMFSMKIFGISLYSFRLVNVIISLISYYYFYKLVSKYDSKVSGLFVLLMLTILPIYIMKARWGLESYLFNPLLIISLYYFMKSIDRKRNLYYFVSGILFGITLYTYAISYLILPLFLGIMIVYLLKKKYITIKNIIVLGIPLFILALPLMLMLLVNNGIIDEIVTPIFSIPKLLWYRGSELSFFNIKYILFDLKIIFVGDILEYNTTIYGTMYYIGPMLIVMGIIVFIKDKKYKDIFGFMMISLFISNFLVFLFVKELNVNKCNSIYVCLVYFIAYYLKYLFCNRKRIILSCCLVFNLISYVLFINFYFNDFDVYYFIKDNYYEALDYSNKIYASGNYTNICVNMEPAPHDRVYTSLYYRISPYEFQKSNQYIYDCKDYDSKLIYVTRDISSFSDDNLNIEKFGEYYVVYGNEKE